MIRYGLAPVQETGGEVTPSERRPRPTGPGQTTIARHRDFEADRQGRCRLLLLDRVWAPSSLANRRSEASTSRV